jgi:putative CocE/NonD family hydrolase
MGGWFDGFSRGTIWNFEGIAAKNNRLIMAPCTHKGCGPPFDPASEYSAEAAPPGYDDVVLAWMDRFLKGKKNGIDKDSPVLYFDIGSHKWERANTWPPEDSQLETFYLSGEASGSSQSLNDGTLAAEAPAEDGSNDLPHDPTVGIAETFAKWGTVAGSPHVRLDQRIDESRSLTYTTPELTEPLTLAGPIELHFWGATTGSDADWVVKVTDVAPDGASTLLTTGFVRSSHRTWDPKRSEPGFPWLPNDKAAEVPMAEPMEHRVDVWDIATTLLKGHRLRVIVMPSDGTNHIPLMEPAVNTLFFGPKFPSELILTTR